MFFSWLDWSRPELRVFERKTLKGRFRHIISRVYIMNMMYHWWCWPWSLGQGSVCQVSPLPLWKEVTVPGPHLRSVGSHAPASEGQSIYINYFMLFYMGDLSCFSHLFVQPFIYISKDYCFILWVLYYLFCCSNGSSFGHWEHFQSAPVSLWRHCRLID